MPNLRSLRNRSFADGAYREVQAFADLAIRQPFGREPGHLEFAGSQLHRGCDRRCEQ
jgi:hypothetical protein